MPFVLLESLPFELGFGLSLLTQLSSLLHMCLIFGLNTSLEIVFHHDKDLVRLLTVLHLPQITVCFSTHTKLGKYS